MTKTVMIVLGLAAAGGATWYVLKKKGMLPSVSKTTSPIKVGQMAKLGGRCLKVTKAEYSDEYGAWLYQLEGESAMYAAETLSAC